MYPMNLIRIVYTALYISINSQCIFNKFKYKFNHFYLKFITEILKMHD